MLNLVATLALALLLTAQGTMADPLPSWNDTQAKRAILDFVDRVTSEGGDGYVAPDWEVIFPFQR